MNHSCVVELLRFDVVGVHLAEIPHKPAKSPADNTEESLVTVLLGRTDGVCRSLSHGRHSRNQYGQQYGYGSFQIHVF
ncbi:Uncharacterised protein [Chlamydia trachomatis]|nr:Uncharacterised protein [Chlamydia trachomatis]